MISPTGPDELERRRTRSAPPSPPAPRLRRDRALELGVFLSLILPPMVISFFLVDQSGLRFPWVAASTIAHDLSLVTRIAFSVHVGTERFSAIGWAVGSGPREALLGVVVSDALLRLGSIDAVLRSVGLSRPARPRPDLVPVRDAPLLLLAVLLVAVVAFADETIFRGYLMRRIEQAAGSVSHALVLSAVVFALGHAYEGTSGVVTVGCSVSTLAESTAGAGR